MLCEAGTIVESDPRAALRWYMKSAEQNDSIAFRYLGMYHLNGLSGEANTKVAIEWLEKADELKDASAAGMLAQIYRDGIGVEKDEQAAKKWGEKATAQSPNTTIKMVPVEVTKKKTIVDKDGKRVVVDVTVKAWALVFVAKKEVVPKKEFPKKD